MGGGPPPRFFGATPVSKKSSKGSYPKAPTGLFDTGVATSLVWRGAPTHHPLFFAPSAFFGRNPKALEGVVLRGFPPWESCFLILVLELPRSLVPVGAACYHAATRAPSAEAASARPQGARSAEGALRCGRGAQWFRLVFCGVSLDARAGRSHPQELSSPLGAGVLLRNLRGRGVEKFTKALTLFPNL